MQRRNFIYRLTWALIALSCWALIFRELWKMDSLLAAIIAMIVLAFSNVMVYEPAETAVKYGTQDR